MKKILTILIFITAQAQAQFNPLVMNYVEAIATASSSQKLNGNRYDIACGLISALSTDCTHNGVTYINVWNKDTAIYPMLGDTAHSTALGMDAKRYVVLSQVSTVVFYRDSIKSNGSSGYMTTGYTLPNNSTNFHAMFFSNTDLGIPGSGVFPVDIGCSNSNRFVMGCRSYVSSGVSGTRVQLYNAANLTLTLTYGSGVTTKGMWIWSRSNSSNVDVYYNGAAVSGSPVTSTAGTITPGIAWIFKVTDGSYVPSRSSCTGVSLGASLTSSEALSLYNAFQNFKMNRLQ